MNDQSPYDPLEYSNLTINLIRELMSRGPYRLPLSTSFSGPGVYALFYPGSHEAYQKFTSPDASRPIYVGKAVLPGARKGGAAGQGSKTSLHAESRSMSKVLLQRKILISLTLPAVISWLSHFGLPWQKDS